MPTAAQAAAEQISNGTFDSEIAPWYAYGHVADSLRLEDGALCVDVPAGTVNPWDVAIGLNEVPAMADEGYQLSFTAKASTPVTVNAFFQLGEDPWTQIAGGYPTVGTEPASFSYAGTSPVSSSVGQVVFQVGGKADAFTLCIDDVSLLGGVEPPKYTPDTGPRVRVNQVGYLPHGPKGATLITEATESVAWQLVDGKGKVVRKGKSTPRGVDETSGENVHTIDFSTYTRVGTGLTLVADGETSRAFDIAPNLYEPLRKDAMTFFYTNRSGISILDSIAPGYGREAGHIGVPPNKGDTAVSCQAPVDFMDDWTCDPSSVFDVTGGWYDAGDHGKYVVNGGISVAQLMSIWERNLWARSADRGALRDGTLRVPETGNRVPDVLDEARWELEWMLKMQVPADTTDPGLAPYAGMAFHKVHDDAWTGLPLDPAKNDKLRELHRPSTAATLNLAAAAAQGARVYAPFDKAFARKLLSAAKSAYAAAKANPAVYAPDADGNSGGGAYGDNNVVDEFYWAAAELYLSSGDKAYLADVKASPLDTADVFDIGGFGWQGVAAVARLDLATAPTRVHVPGRDKYRRSVLEGANKLLAVQAKQAYAQPYAPANNVWVWGSNSQLLNNLVVIGTAYDISGASKYRTGVLQGLDFLLGRNALNISYVTGYGEVYSKNQHTRMYANQLDANLPNPPAGTVAGGPNSEIQDPVAQKNLKGCIAQFCYIDDIGSWSTNEITINWNAPMAWVASFAADLDNGAH
ncbi:MAG: glycosyl hydrolase family 5 [Actinomycetales bacterium]|nr:glycosyl hydrolase family 5 [Actinomycetales bacterium]